jgi:hypothetical protein
VLCGFGTTAVSRIAVRRDLGVGWEVADRRPIKNSQYLQISTRWLHSLVRSSRGLSTSPSAEDSLFITTCMVQRQIGQTTSRTS